MTTYRINHSGVRSDSPEEVYFENKYTVTAVHLLTPEFEGTYTQCLIYVGARSMGKSHEIAVRFARGIYV